MYNLTSAEKISLKNHPEIKESTIQKYIFDNPAVLGLGDLSPIRREKIQPSGGRLDILLGDDSTHYEVEIQLGATDPSHIIRTIEYWDTERKRFPQYDHCAVIIAEEITSRFLNVISLFNGSIPLIALQLCATQNGNNICLNFIKVLDRNNYGTDSEDEAEPADRKYWEAKCKTLSIVDTIYTDVSAFASGFELKYNKYYIGVAQNGVATNFIWFRPKKNHVYLFIKGSEDLELSEQLEEKGFDFDYYGRDHGYRLKLENTKAYENNKEFIKTMILRGMEHMNISI